MCAARKNPQRDAYAVNFLFLMPAPICSMAHAGAINKATPTGRGVCALTYIPLRSFGPCCMNQRSGKIPAALPQGQPSTKETNMNKDQVKGRMKEAGGKVKEITGKVVGNESLEAEGKVDQVVGEVQADYGDLKEDVKDAIKKPA